VVGYDFFVTPGGWAEICSGQDPKAVATTCIAAGILAPDSEGKASRVMRVNKSQPTRWYVIPHGGLTKFKQRDGGVVRDVLDDVVDADDDVAADGGFMSNV